MKLLKELTEFDYDYDEAMKAKEESGGKLILRGVIQRADTLNQNGRIYPRDILEREVQNYKKLVEERRATGELDHADEPVVNLKNVSHVITNIWIDKDTIMGEVEVLDSLPMGKILRGLIESKIKVGISSRALGSVDHTANGDVVQDDLHFICWDFVSEPSTPGAWMVKEGLEFNSKILKKVFDRDYRIYRTVNEIISLHENLKKQ